MDYSKLSTEELLALKSELSGGGMPPAKPSAENIYSYLREKKVPHNNALGMIANIQAESNFDPANDTGDGGTSIGLFQHHNERATGLKDRYGDKWNDWKNQIDYAIDEPHGQQYLAQNFTTPQDASRYFTTNFEMPKDANLKAEERLQYIPDFQDNGIPQQQQQSQQRPSYADMSDDELLALKDQITKQAQPQPQAEAQPKPNMLSKQGIRDYFMKTGSGDDPHFSPLLKEKGLAGLLDLGNINAGDAEGGLNYLKSRGYQNAEIGENGKLLVNGEEVNPSVMEDILGSASQGKGGGSLGDLLQLGANIPSYAATAGSDVLNNVPFIGTPLRNAVGKLAGTREGPIFDSEAVLNAMFDMPTGVHAAAKNIGRNMYGKAANLGKLLGLDEMTEGQSKKQIENVIGYNFPSKEKDFFRAASEKQREVGGQLDERFAQMGRLPFAPVESQIREIPNSPKIKSTDVPPAENIVNKFLEFFKRDKPVRPGEVGVLRPEVLGPETFDPKYGNLQKSALAKKYEGEGLKNDIEAQISDVLRNQIREGDKGMTGVPIDELNRSYHTLSDLTGTTEKLFQMRNDPLANTEHMYANVRPDSIPNFGMSNKIFGDSIKTGKRAVGKSLYNFGNKEALPKSTQLTLTALERLLNGDTP